MGSEICIRESYSGIPAFIHAWIHGVCPCGFPHSEIRGSLDICSSPRLFAAYHVFLRLSVPRHPPCALFSLTCSNCYAITAKAASQLYFASLLHNFSLTFRCIALQLPVAFSVFCSGDLSPCRTFLSGLFTLFHLLYEQYKPRMSFHCFFGSSVFGFQGTSCSFRPFYGTADGFKADITSRQMLCLTYPLGLSGLEPPTSRLSGVRSNRLSYKPRLNQ